jgi:aldehyde:ferredoxin oxidoreductase
MKSWEAPRLREGFDHRGHQCNACGMHHCHMSVIRQGPYKGKIVDEPEYEGWSGAGWTIGATDQNGIAWLNTQTDRACVDVNEFGWVIGWVREGLEKGWLTRQQVGLDLKWGDVAGANRLLQMINRREGFGDLLAEGVKRAAEKLGGEAAKAAIYTGKGASPRGHDHRGRWEEMLDTATSSIGTMETGNPVHQTELGLPARINPFDGVEVAKLVAGCRGRRAFEDSLGICIFTTRTRLENVCRALSAATGWYYTVAEAMRFGRRTAAINRATALRCGLGPDLEKPSFRYGSTPENGPAAGHAVSAQWEKMVDTWYREIGYDRKTGKPLPQTLKDLGLAWLAKELWGRK